MAKTAEKDRKARVEEMRRAQAAAERRRTLLVVGAAVVAVLVLAGIVFKVVRDAQADKDVTNVGVALAAASCDPVTNDKPNGQQVHVGPQTDKPDVTKVNYTTVPPAFGQHFVTPAYPSLPFYTTADRPRMETLVHNLEHGYTLALVHLEDPAGADRPAEEDRRPDAGHERDRRQVHRRAPGTTPTARSPRARRSACPTGARRPPTGSCAGASRGRPSRRS